MNTFLDYLAVAVVFTLVALPSLIGHLKERAVDRQLARAEAGLPALDDPLSPPEVARRAPLATGRALTR
ncbi:hypothetical protein [Streptomyces sp. NPDC050504]|uniref:hypothetical protein n=1 Tax=Streptomyces sp. NPDC050504 TaxID=3365618 RepID=UPI0037A08D49